MCGKGRRRKNNEKTVDKPEVIRYNEYIKCDAGTMRPKEDI